jgi:rubredoxin---NAD+ reductase
MKHSMKNAPLVIIGSGLAGYSLAREYRRLDQDREVLMITADDGAYYSKPMLSTAFAKQQTSQQLVIKTKEQMESQLGIRVLANMKVERIDRADKTVVCSDQAFKFSKCVVAVGASPREIPFAGDAGWNSLYKINHLHELAHFQQGVQHRKHVAILGSGLVGCEFMNDLVTAGYKVSVISQDAYPLQSFIPSREMADQLKAVYRDQWQVNWYLGQSIKALHHASPASTFDDGTYELMAMLANGETVEADIWLSALGLQVNTGLAENAGLKVNQGIVVDQYQRTSDDDIYAIGDCAELGGRLRQYVAPILHSCRALAKTLTGHFTAVEYPPMPVQIKTTQCPVVLHIPDTIDEYAQWQLTGEAQHQQALLKCDDQLHGFVLMGDAVSSKMNLLKALNMLV